jgi:hypothetical protein
MSIEEAVVERLKLLPPDKQREVLDFVESLQRQGNGTPHQRRKSLRGLWAGLGVNVTDEDISEARREMWGNFPRDIEP